MKKVLKAISLTLSTVILCLSLFGFTNNSLSKVEAMELETDNTIVAENKIETEQKIYSNATIDGDFAEDSVIIVFKKSTSDYNRIFTTKDFSEIKCKSINDITKYKT